MLGTPLNINITRKTKEVDDVTNKYIELEIYTNLEVTMIEVKHKDSSNNISQNEAIQYFAFMLAQDKTNIKI
jgi:hypothetical protein